MDGKASPQLGYIWAAPDPILIVDHDGQIEFVNMSALRLFGYTAPELIGQPVKVVLPDLRMPPFGPAVSEQPAWRCDGTSLPAEVTVSQGDTRQPAIVVVRDLSDRKRAAAAEARLTLVTRSSHEAIVARDLDGIVTDWNPGATRLYGYRPDEVIGRHCLDLVPDGRRAEEETIHLAVARGQVLDRHRAVRYRKDGTPVQVSITMSPITDDSGEIIGVLAVSQAVSTEELADAKIVGVLEAVPDAIVVADAKGFIVLANAQATRLLGYSRDELVGQPVEMLVPAELRRSHVVHRTRYVSNPVTRPMNKEEELTAQRKDGTHFPADISLSSLQTDDGLLVAATIRDATDRIEAEQEHDRLKAVAEQERLARQLQQNQRMESLGQLAGGIAHDFNNLLALIVNYSAFVAEEVGSAAGADPGKWGPLTRDIEQIQRAADRGTALTHQLLAFGRREVARPRVITVNSVIDDVSRMLGRSLGENIALRRRLADDLWLVRADPAQIEQVLVNLAMNARDAMPKGGTVTFSTENAVFTEHTDVVWPGRYVRIRVSDTGVGMSPEVMARAFEPFFTTKPKGEGAGLGLATVHGIITEVAGVVQISSRPQRGTTFTIVLPATDGPLHKHEKKPPTAPKAKATETILICEEESAIREVARRILARNGYEVIVAEDGLDAVRLARTHAGPLHLVLTDAVPPQVLGTDVAEAIRAIRPEIRAVRMSGYGEEGLLSAVRDVLET